MAARKTKTAKTKRAARENGKLGGRPMIQIDWDEFDKLCQMHATLQEIAGWFKCSEDTIENAVKQVHHMGFSDYWALKSAGGKVSLRRSQWQKALAGDNTMMIWLGKQHLGQTDKAQHEQHIQTENRVIYLPDNGRGK